MKGDSGVRLCALQYKINGLSEQEAKELLIKLSQRILLAEGRFGCDPETSEIFVNTLVGTVLGNQYFNVRG